MIDLQKFMVTKLVSFYGSRKLLTTCTRVPRRASVQDQLNPAHILRPHFVKYNLVLSSLIRICILFFLSFSEFLINIIWVRHP